MRYGMAWAGIVAVAVMVAAFGVAATAQNRDAREDERSAPLAGGSAAGSADAPTADVYEGFTRPSLEVTLAGRVDGLVAEVLVEEGQRVRAGEAVLRLDAAIEQIEVELSRLRAESGKKLEAMRLIAEQKAAELERARQLVADGGITGVEVEQRELELKVARLNVEIAENEQEVARLEHRRNLARLARREITAPVDGIITRIRKDPGEAVERLESVAELVQIDPLEIVLHVPVTARGRYVRGRTALVRLEGVADSLEAEVTAVDPVVDFGSNTFRLKLQLPNTDGRLPAGLRATVDLSE